MRYYIADLHFYHRSLNEHMDCRGFADVEAMNDYMIEQWNKKVRKNDEVVVLGDFCWGSAEQTQDILDQLHGKIYLIVGNHDRFLDDKKFDASRFGWVKHYAELNENRRKVILSHYPIACYNGQYRKDEQGNPKTYMLHGHIHKTQDQQLIDFFEEYVKSQTHQAIGGGVEKIPCHFINCFCMYSDYQPMTLDEWLEIDKKRKGSKIN